MKDNSSTIEKPQARNNDYFWIGDVVQIWGDRVSSMVPYVDDYPLVVITEITFASEGEAQYLKGFIVPRSRSGSAELEFTSDDVIRLAPFALKARLLVSETEYLAKQLGMARISGDVGGIYTVVGTRPKEFSSTHADLIGHVVEGTEIEPTLEEIDRKELTP